MRSKIAGLLCLVVALGVAFASYVPPTVQIDMDGPAADRWSAAVATVLGLHSWKHSFGAIFAHVNESVFDKLPANTYDVVSTAVRTHWPLYAAELQGLVAAFGALGHPEITFEYLSVWSYYHTLGHADFGGGSAFRRLAKKGIRECSGVLVADAQGAVTHGRNMDNYPPELRNVTLHLQLRVGGQIVAEGAGWYWSSCGFMTALMPGVVTLEENWRMRYQDVNGTDIMNAIAQGVMSQNWFFREALFTQQLRDFDDIVSFLANEPTPAPMYAILSGPKPYQGAVITRDPTQRFDVLSLANATGPDAWFLVNTNYDHWKPDPTDDPRRTVAETALRTLGQTNGATVSGVLGVMNTYPVNNEDTVFTAVMQSATGVWQLYGQDGKYSL